MQYDISSLLLNSGYKTFDILFKPCTELQYPNSYKNCHSFVSWNHAAHTELPDEDGPCCEVDGGFKHYIATYCLHPGPPATPFSCSCNSKTQSAIGRDEATCRQSLKSETLARTRTRMS
ncbi:hypothetical protein FOXG_19560 [Fusarium oxysporum f. sp. lycopersici 4287]|uniref:Uncharacterized protein n=2 Tax=Fusarium oxysporum TaxID=5507 RepID=A0A0J9V2Z8_FUSO4|nr:hypothetical protein FOXG_19560 [Fusarium oxysporum f. sp. lycopersici 4287]EXK45231.1 hypothetical protein FOMG_03738 [Fusarium oxysporum f. sp. melonis 26406]KNB05899.1 hypothetical protein FOXG_19560 [Fusarium oxysporum f. sp. lycopersici 4287]